MMRKKIMLVGPPFSGHLHPLLGIAKCLQSVAEVLVVSTPGGIKEAKIAGVCGHEILVEQEQQVWEIAEPGENVKKNPFKMWRQVQSNVSLMMTMKNELDAMICFEKPDLIIADFTIPVAGLSAMEHGVPWWTTLPSPCVLETPDGPPAYFGGQIPAQNTRQKMKHALMRMVTRQFKRCVWFLLREKFRLIGLQSIYRDDGSEAIYSPHRILALGVPEIEFQRTYPEHFQFVGPVLYTPPCTNSEPAFQDNAKPHVLVSLGTHLPHQKNALANVVRGIAQRHPDIVFHFTHGKQNAVTLSQSENFHEYSYISYSDHLPRYDLVVHHAGAGVMNHCLQHAKPSVVHPLDYDQFDNAARLVACGLAVLAQSRMELEGAILHALQDITLRKKCVTMSHIYSQIDALGCIKNLVTQAPI